MCLGFIVEGASRACWDAVFATAVPLLVLGLLWFIRFGFAALQALTHQDASMSGRTLVRWLVVPALVVATGAVVVADLPFQVRLALGRPAMDRDATEILAGGSTDRTSIGPFPAENIEVVEGTVRFEIAGSGLIAPVGLAYAPVAPPTDPTGEIVFVDVGGGWWDWSYSSWD